MHHLTPVKKIVWQEIRGMSNVGIFDRLISVIDNNIDHSKFLLLV